MAASVMHDLKTQREKLRLNAADCDLIASLATEPRKREMFAYLAAQLKNLVAEIDEEIAQREAKSSARDYLHGVQQDQS